MIKLFYAIGDSFVFGQEMGPPLTPENYLIFDDYKRSHCYTGIISDTLKIENYKNSSGPAGSNERSHRVLINEISEALLIYKPEEIFVSVGLTSPTRREFCMSEVGQYFRFMHVYAPNVDHNIPCYDLWNILVKDFGYDQGYEMFNIMQMLAIQNFLRINKIPYLMSYSLRSIAGLMTTHKYVPKSLLKQLYATRIYSGRSFDEFTRTSGYKIGEGNHPLEEAHAAWAEYILSHITRNNLMDNTDL